ncbi:nuclear transport factor 2 family protein [Algoriphagus machipongonensis]|uniref:histidine kinase n=1 Tax=Algoriphagus machipongonensis TaxID=388413 RepID=A3HV45_9BACT|nr:nuclear transport factor 2 family protein [Algoriphagus machipongonensis]EAZ82017.1 sensor histidine kinase [Algoriphagus machipongonensis]
MQLEKTQQTEVLALYQDWLYAYINGDIKTYDSYFSDDYHFIGSTDNEEYLSRKETTAFFESTADQLAGKTELRNDQITVEKIGELIFITHFFDAWFLNNGDWNYYGRFRCTSALRMEKEGFRFVYQHFSMPDAKALEGETIGYDQINEENRELREAIKRRTNELENKTRELEIEASLEKIRSRSLAMKSSEELADASILLEEEIRKLGIENWGCAFHIYDEESSEATPWDLEWFTSSAGILPFYKTPRENIFLKYYKESKKGKPLYIQEFGPEVIKEHYDYLKTLPVLGEALTDLHNSGVPLPEKQIDHVAFFNHGHLLFITYKPVPEAHNIFIRFAKVFDQAYTRFLDLQKAEWQARESQIQLALERVRARTMAMQKSEELADAANLLFSQIQSLGMPAWSTGYCIWSDDKKDVTLWMSSEGVLQPPFIAPTNEDELFIQMLKGHVEGKLLHVVEMGGEKLKAHYKYMRTLPVVGEILDSIIQAGHPLPTFQVMHNAYFSKGFLLFITYESVTEAHEIFVRFAKVFDQAYTRFLDLQKAEAQAKEARIESALERIRGQVASMRESTELLEIMVSMRKEFVDLGNEAHYFWHMRWHPDSYEKAMTSGDGTQIGMVMSLPRRIHGDIKLVADWEKGNDPILVLAMETETAVDYVHKMITWGDFERVDPQAPTLDDIRHIGGLTFVMARTSHGEIGFSLPGSVPNPSQDAMDTLVRFAKVFDLAYKRFEDLKNAEYQTRETQIELALERVRSRSMGMQKSDELQEVIKLVYQQLIQLKINLDHAGFVVDYTPKGDWHFWIADEQNIPSKITHPYFESVWATQFHNAKENGTDFFVTNLDFEEKNKFYNELLTHVPGVTEEAKAFYLNCHGLAITTALSANVSLYIENFSGTPYTESENKIVMRFGKVFEQSYTRFLDLQKAEAQARKASIETSLERVRAQTMAMHNSQDIGKCIVLMFEELTALGVNIQTRFGIGILNHENENNQLWTARKEGGEFKLHIGHLEMSWHPLLKSARKAWKAQESLHRYVLEGEDLLNYYKMLNQAPDYKIQIALEKLPEREFHYGFVFEHGFFYAFSPIEFSEDLIQIIHRFSSQFAQTYRRYLDLKKAEEQAKEAKIEAALERIRSRSLAMHQSSELSTVVETLLQEFTKLEFTLTFCIINLIDEQDMSNTVWAANPETGKDPESYYMKFEDYPFHHAMWDAWKSQKKRFIYTIEGEEKKIYDEYLYSETEFRRFPKHVQDANKALKRYVAGFTFFKFSGLQTVSEEYISEDDLTILERFGRVFEQAYTRFLDLQKAEAQAREAQIELSLERIRALVTAMRQSDELFDIVVSMRKEFISLGHEADYFWHMKWTPENYQMSMTSEDGEKVGMIITVPKFVHDEISRLAEWEKSDSPIISLDLNGPEAWDYIDKMNTYGKYEQADPHAPSKEDILAIGGLTFVIARTTHGEIGFSLPGQVPNPPQESTDTLIRFAGVFDLAYRRFEDLLTAEKQNRKAKIELALERVRARALAMQEPEELIEVAQVMREEMGLVGVEELETSSIYINKNTTGLAECWYSIKDIREGTKTYLADHFNLNYQDTWVGRKMLDFYQSEEKKTSIVMKGENRIEWINYCAKQSPKLNGYYGKKIPERTYHLTKFSNGAIGAATPGEISSESWDLLARASSVFSLAYSRFRDLSQAREDLKKLKKAKARAEKALKELKAAQEQLVQQEKLASLGQLTAGIAHEIKNPLNFVNNFSDLSRELVDEVFDELKNIQDSDSKEEIIAILEDVKSNLAKVHEHGTRADGIVKSMLQHSRASNNKMESKAINPIIKEFVNLAFHGMRAGKNPINVTIDLQLKEEVGELKIISEDFSRVILNLCNNAFDAMRDKMNVLGSGNYEAKLTVNTYRSNGKVLLEFIDNGPGIPEEIIGKILQPFFTTKKGTEGTGLGLSITHDIIKAHGGNLLVTSEINEGSKMTIVLPFDPK